jgi:hypothetical protein
VVGAAWSSDRWSGVDAVGPPRGRRTRSAGAGTVRRPDTVRAYATDAGFSHVEVLPINHDFWRFYRLVP